MPSPTAPADGFDLAAAPMSIGRVTLRVRDLDVVSRFYQSAIGLSALKTAPDEVCLGVGQTTLLQLLGNPKLAPRNPRAAGLFHTAFLLPNRAYLGSWLAHARASRLHISGASDHKVSEAIYLSDPEGNGIEIYADRPPSLWEMRNGLLSMPSNPLDLQDLLDSGRDTKWSGMPEGSVVGHIHLQVGDIATAERFYGNVLGFAITCRYPGAVFFGSGGYHHQLAANIWNSRGAGLTEESATGLDRFEIKLQSKALLDSILERVHSANIATANTPKGITLRDPWGVELILLSIEN